MADKIVVEVVLALPDKQYLRRIEVGCGTTLAEAVNLSGLADEFTQYTAAGLFGIFGKKAAADTVLQENDRVEIYRPLLIDPKTARRMRAQQSKHDTD